MRKIYVVLVSICLVFSISSCSKDNKDYIELKSEGSINGTINSDNVDFGKETFNFSTCSGGNGISTYSIDYANNYIIQISRTSSDFQNYSSVSITCTASGIVNSAFLSINYYKEIGTKILNYKRFSYYNSENTPNLTITDFTFDENTGKVSFKYLATLNAQYSSSNSKLDNSTIEGSVNATVYKIVSCK